MALLQKTEFPGVARFLWGRLIHSFMTQRYGQKREIQMIGWKRVNPQRCIQSQVGEGDPAAER